MIYPLSVYLNNSKQFHKFGFNKTRKYYKVFFENKLKNRFLNLNHILLSHHPTSLQFYQYSSKLLRLSAHSTKKIFKFFKNNTTILFKNLFINPSHKKQSIPPIFITINNQPSPLNSTLNIIHYKFLKTKMQ